MTDKTLSEKIIYDSIDSGTSHEGLVLTEDVREAVKKLKEELSKDELNRKWNAEPLRLIDEIFGEALTGEDLK